MRFATTLFASLTVAFALGLAGCGGGGNTDGGNGNGNGNGGDGNGDMNGGDGNGGNGDESAQVENATPSLAATISTEAATIPRYDIV
jgi:hypothetical protein